MRNLDIDFGRTGNRMFQMSYIYAQVLRGELPDIFVQDYKYFDDFREEIKKLYGQGIGLLPYTGIHLRVGGNPINPDEPRYMENPFYTNLANTGYYLKALEHFPHGKFIVFSDDMDYAREYFQGARFAFDDSKDDLEAFNKLASCQNLIMANSSWSWWAGYLNQHVEAKIICPSEKSWFADGQIRAKVLPEWISIDP